VMAARLGVPCTEQSYEDAFLAFGSRAHVGSDFEVARLKQQYSCSADDLKGVLRSFERCNTSDSGAMAYDEFCQAVSGLGGSGRLSQEAALFAYFDQDKSGAVEYRDFIQVAALLSGRGSESSRLQLAFLVADMEGSGSAAASFVAQLTDGDTLSQDLSFAEFRDLAFSQPALVDTALEMLRRHMQIPRFEGKTAVDKKEQ
ncbi:Ppp3r2, partial [Symbiodinium necroappetens]